MFTLRVLSLILVISSVYFIRSTSSYSASSYSQSEETGSTQEEETTNPTCATSNHNHKPKPKPNDLRIKRAAAPTKRGVLVCISSKDSSVNVQNGQKEKDKKHHKDTDDEDNSGEENKGSSDDDSDSNETLEETSDNNQNHNGLGGSGHQHHSSKPQKGKGKHKGKENFRIIIEEQFSYRNWSTEWVQAKNPDNGTKLYNKFSRVYARKSNHSRPDYGIITHNKGGEFYLIATTFPPFSTRNESLVLQFSVQFQSKAHCQLAFLRLYDCQFGTEDFGMQTPYVMQVGPHVCGTSNTNRITTEFQEPGKATIRSVDKRLEPPNNTLVNIYALALDADGSYHVILNTQKVQNGNLRDEFSNFKGYTGICGVGLVVWHSVLDKYFKGQIIIDDILVVNDAEYAEKKRAQILNLHASK